jgi:hypothetical protein
VALGLERDGKMARGSVPAFAGRSAKMGWPILCQPKKIELDRRARACANIEPDKGKVLLAVGISLCICWVPKNNGSNFNEIFALNAVEEGGNRGIQGTRIKVSRCSQRVASMRTIKISR